MGRCKVRGTARQTGVEFAEHLRRVVDEDDPEAEQMVLVVKSLPPPRALAPGTKAYIPPHAENVS